MLKTDNKIQLSEYEKQKFSLLMAEKNIAMGNIFIKIIAVFEVFLVLCTVIFIKNKSLPLYLSFYGGLLAVSFCMLFFINYCKRDIEKYAKKINLSVVCYSAIVTVWSVIITVLDWHNGVPGSMAYLTLMVSICSAMYLLPQSILSLQVSALAMLIISLVLDGGRSDSRYLVNLIVFTVICTLIAFHKYYNLLSDFKLQRTVLEKNVKLKELNEKLRIASCTDALTGVNNRWGLHFVLDDLFNECMRQKKPFSVIMFDVDDFKLVNDTFGHKAGDECLLHVAGIFKKHIDPRYVFRYGGEEFVGVLAGVSAEQAVEISESIRSELESSEFSNIKVTISGGVYSKIPDITSTTDEFLVGADKALYDAKSLGKNMIIYNANASNDCF